MKINLNTLKYVVAVDSHRNFVKAAEACGVSQPALSAAIKNMEEELDTVIFDRNSHPARPTPSGEKIISMARATLRSASMIEEFILGERGGTGGEVSIGTIPTVAPYVLPGLFREMRGSWPEVRLRVSEMRTASLIEKLRSDRKGCWKSPSTTRSSSHTYPLRTNCTLWRRFRRKSSRRSVSGYWKKDTACAARC